MELKKLLISTKKKEKIQKCLKEDLKDVSDLIVKQVNEFCARERKKQRKKQREQRKREHQNAAWWQKPFKINPTESPSSSSAEDEEDFNSRQQQEMHFLKTRHMQRWSDLSSSSETSNKDSDSDYKQKTSLTQSVCIKKKKRKKQQESREQKIQMCVLSAYNYRATNLVSSDPLKAKQQMARLVAMQNKSLEKIECKSSSSEEEQMLKLVEKKTEEKKLLVDNCLKSKTLLGWSTSEAEERLQAEWKKVEKKKKKKKKRKKKRQYQQQKVELAIEAKECLEEPASSAQEVKEHLSSSEQDTTPTSPLRFFEFHFSEPGEPPDNNTSPPPYLSDNRGEPFDQNTLDDTSSHINDEETFIIHKNTIPVYPETFSPSQQEAEKELICTLQQITTLYLKDIAHSLQRIEQEVKQINANYHIFASIDKGKKKTYASQVGLISSITENVYLGLSYSYTHHNPYIIQTAKSDIISTKAENHIFSGSITFNPNNPGITGSLKGAYGLGKAKNSCFYFYSNEQSSESTPTRLKGSALYIGYSIFWIPQYILTPYIECTKLYTTIYGYTEHKIFGSKHIHDIKAGLTEVSFGVHNNIHLTKAIHLHGHLEYIRGIQKHPKLSSIYKTKHNVYYTSTSAYKKIYTQVGLGASINIPLTTSFGLSFYGTLYSKTKAGINKDSIGICLWYEF